MASKSTDKPSGAVVAWAVLLTVVLFFGWIAICGWGIEISWNALTQVTHLPQISWTNGVDAFVLGYFISLALGLRNRGGKADG